MSIKQLFEGQELSEEFVTKAEALIEAQIDESKKALQEEYDAKVKTLEEKTEEYVQEEVLPFYESQTEAYVNEEIMPQVDKYLTAAVNEWIEENKLAVESGIKVQVAESLFEGMKTVMSENNIEFDVDSDAFTKVNEELEATKSKLDELTESKIELQERVVAMQKKEVVADVCSDLTESQKEKIADLTESVSYKDDEQFKTAVEGLIESYFPANAEDKTDVNEANQISESNNNDDEVEENSYFSQFLKVYK